MGQASRGLRACVVAAILAGAPSLLSGSGCAQAVNVESQSSEGGGGEGGEGDVASASASGAPSGGSTGSAAGTGGAASTGSAGMGGAGGSGSGGAGVCVPGSQKLCYSGPPVTEGVGACKEGAMTCKPDASGFGPCEGEILPALENCDTPTDDDCDGEVNEVSAGCGADTCAGCTISPAPVCASDTVVVGHYEGGNRTVCIAQGDGTPFKLALMSYDTTFWTLSGATARVTQLQIYSVDPLGAIQGNGAIPTSIQQGGSSPADPYDYSGSMGDCPAHTGYTGAVFGVPQADVCHMEQGLPDACGYPSYACLSISP